MGLGADPDQTPARDQTTNNKNLEKKLHNLLLEPKPRSAKESLAIDYYSYIVTIIETVNYRTFFHCNFLMCY